VGEDQSQTGRQRLTVAETSEILGVTVEAVRGRIKRGTLDHERTDMGVFVLYPSEATRKPLEAILAPLTRAYLAYLPDTARMGAPGRPYPHPRSIVRARHGAV
jgi:hypothetical protein